MNQFFPFLRGRSVRPVIGLALWVSVVGSLGCGGTTNKNTPADAAGTPAGAEGSLGGAATDATTEPANPDSAAKADFTLAIPEAVASAAQTPPTMRLSNFTRDLWDPIIKGSPTPGELETKEEFTERLQAFVDASLPPLVFEVRASWQYDADSALATVTLDQRERVGSGSENARGVRYDNLQFVRNPAPSIFAVSPEEAPRWVERDSSRLFLVARVGIGPKGSPSLGLDGPWSDLQDGIALRDRVVWVGRAWIIVTDRRGTTIRDAQPVDVPEGAR